MISIKSAFHKATYPAVSTVGHDWSIPLPRGFLGPTKSLIYHTYDLIILKYPIHHLIPATGHRTSRNSTYLKGNFSTNAVQFSHARILRLTNNLNKQPFFTSC